MFVRRKRCPNGKFSVSIIDNVGGKPKTICTLGTSSDPLVIDRLETKGRELIRQMAGPELPLESGLDSVSAQSIAREYSSDKLKIAGPELVFGAIYDKLGFSSIKDKMFRHLAISLCLADDLSVSAAAYLKDYTREVHTASDISTCVDKFAHKKKDEVKDTVRSSLEIINLSRPFSVDGAILYINEISYSDASDEQLKAIGKKKMPSSSPMRLGLLLLKTSEGSPICYDTCTSAALHSKRIVSCITSLIRRYGIQSYTVVAGTNILCAEAVAALQSRNIPYVMSSGVSGPSLKKGNVPSDMVMVSDPALAKRDAERRQSALDKLQKKIDSGKITKDNLSGRGYGRFLKEENGSIVIDPQMVAKESLYDGMMVFSTNSTLEKDQIQRLYSSLKEVSSSFVINTADILSKPIVHRTRNRLEGLVCTVYVSYCIRHHLKNVLKKNNIEVTFDEVLEAVKTMYQVEYLSPNTGRIRNTLYKMNPLQETLYRLLDNSHQKIRKLD